MVNNLTSSKFWGAGHYPKEYNPKVHGPYYPFRFYGKPEKSIWDLKVSEIPALLGRRNVHPMAVAGAMSRGYWRWMHKWMEPIKGGAAPLLQAGFLVSFIMYVGYYPFLRYERHCKYHW